MAGDWIKMEKTTPRKPEVLAIADHVGCSPDEAFGMCFRFWSWCDDHLKTGHAKNVTLVTLLSVVPNEKFFSALVKVGWLKDRKGALEVPNFDRHLSQSAKNRALATDRKQKERGEKPSRSDRDKSVTREEKRRVNKTPHIPPRGEEGDSGPGNERPVRQRRQPSPGKQVFVLERKAKALEAQAKDLWDKHASDTAMETHWTTPEHQAEYRRLKAAAKQARDQIAAVEVGA